ncbi:MAG TPA: hypothetical protein VF670_17575 [Duganella sp.]|jgi:TolB-like protein
MNARFSPLSEMPVVTPAATEDIWRFVKQLLASPTFAKAPRMCRLLNFLLEKKLAGQEHEINEYAIGLDVFGRDAREYDTTLDPSVRVQIGRLRSRLRAYYAELDGTPAVLITIPLGGYVPVVVQNGPVVAACTRRSVMQVAPLRNLTAAEEADAFVCGLDDELGSRLYRDMGAGVQLADRGSVSVAVDEQGALRLEGSVRVEDNHVRASMRLVDAGAGRVAWLSQFDRHGQLCMSLQEELAAAICSELASYLSGKSVPGGTFAS